MLIAFVLLLAPPVLNADRVQAYVVSSDGPSSYEAVELVRFPSDSELMPLLPKGKGGVGYAHIQCSSIRQNGQPANCKTSREGLGQTASLDPDFERAGLNAAKFFRVSPEFAGRWKAKNFRLNMSIAFVRDGSIRSWGACYPFCQSGLPPAPIAPSRN